MDEHAERLVAVTRLAESHQYDAGHAAQVTRLVLTLFDQLKPLHGLDDDARRLLQYAGLLHDIGWIEGQQAHHKTSLRIILETPHLPFSGRQRLIVASVARYHRKALPSPAHAHFAILSPADQWLVRALAALLRVADGLDYTHRDRVRSLRCEIEPEAVYLQCQIWEPAEEEAAMVAEKSDLFAQHYERELHLEWTLA